MRRLLTVFVFALASVSVTRAADEALPKAETLLDKYVQATGGKAAYEKVKAEMTSGTVELVGRGLKGTIVSYRSEPANNYSVVEFEGVGKIEEGSNGDIAWERSAIQGPRIKEGEERDMTLRNGLFRAALMWRQIYAKVETTGTDTVSDQPCYKVEMTPAAGKPEVRCFDQKTGLLLKLTMTLKSPMGEIAAESIFSDYRDAGGGLLVPRKMEQKAMGQDILFSVDKVQLNPSVPREKFDVPAEVIALVKKPAKPAALEAPKQ